MRKIYGTLRLCTLSLCFWVGVSQAAAQKALCPGKASREMPCLMANFEALYKADYQKFFEILRSAEARAVSCRERRATAEFLSIAPMIKGNAEVQEYFSEALEKLTSRNPKCLLEAAVSLDGASQRSIADFLQHPVFSEKSSIEEKLAPFAKTPKFRNFVQMAFK